MGRRCRWGGAGSALVAVIVAASPATAVETVPRDETAAAALRALAARIRLPEGFGIEFFAPVPGARHLAVAPSGQTVFVGSRGDAVHVVDVAGGVDGHRVRRFAPDLSFDRPNGPCFAPDGTLYVAEANRIRAFPGAEAQVDEAAPPAVTVVAVGALVPSGELGGGHDARTCRIGPDGRLWVSIGQPHNVTPPAKEALYRRLGIGAIVRMERDGSHREVWATGIRNSVGFDFAPKSGDLWFTDNQVDLMGDDRPPGEIDRATGAGQNFGFPWYGGGRVRTREYGDAPVPVDVVFPEVETDAHAADLGMTFYRGIAFPQTWRGGIFSAQHGSWNRHPSIGARVMFTAIGADGRARGTAVFAEGWRRPDGGWDGRPVDVAELPDGSLLVSDDRAGALWRIVYRRAELTPSPPPPSPPP